MNKKYICFLVVFVIVSSLYLTSPIGTRSIKAKDLRSDAPLKDNMGLIKNSIVPTFLYVILEDSLAPGERAMVATLQGVVNSQSNKQIYLLNSSQPDYKVWLEDLRITYGIPYEHIRDPWELIDIFRAYVEGYVLYSSKKAEDPSINNATSLASLNNAIAIEEEMEAKVKLKGITELKGDCRNTEEGWAYENLWDKGLNHSLVIQLSLDMPSSLRDYAIMAKALVFYERNTDKTELRDKIYSSMERNGVVLGWQEGEFTNVSAASKHGVSVVAADWSYNLTVLSAFPSIPVEKEAAFDIRKERDVHYVTFIMSDGDNQQWYLGNNYTSPKWFGAPNRSSLNLGWSISPSIYYLAPTVFNLYYKSIREEKIPNNFIVAPSGKGYMYPSMYPAEDLDSYIDSLGTYMEKVQERYVAVIDQSSLLDIKLWNSFTDNPQIEGLFYLDYSRHDNYQGRILWSNNKPIVSCRDLLWGGIEDEEELVKKINARVSSGQTNPQKADAYTFVYVHVWSKGVNNVSEVVDKLRDNPRIRVVIPEVFMGLIKENIHGGH